MTQETDDKDNWREAVNTGDDDGLGRVAEELLRRAVKLARDDFAAGCSRSRDSLMAAARLAVEELGVFGLSVGARVFGCGYVAARFSLGGVLAELGERVATMEPDEVFEATARAGFEVLAAAAGAESSVVAHVCRRGEVLTFGADGPSSALPSRRAAKVLGDVAHPSPEWPLEEQVDLVTRMAGARLGVERGSVIVGVEEGRVVITRFVGEHAPTSVIATVALMRARLREVERELSDDSPLELPSKSPAKPDIVSRVKGRRLPFRLTRWKGR